MQFTCSLRKSFELVEKRKLFFNENGGWTIFFSSYKIRELRENAETYWTILFDRAFRKETTFSSLRSLGQHVEEWNEQNEKRIPFIYTRQPCAEWTGKIIAAREMCIEAKGREENESIYEAVFFEYCIIIFVNFLVRLRTVSSLFFSIMKMNISINLFC